MKNQQTKILFYCQHSLGMGHLVRSFALAERLAEKFHVTFLNGGMLPQKLPIPPKLEIVNLPPIGFNAERQLISLDRRRNVERAQNLRKNIILDIYKRETPAAVIIELFPFGRKKFGAEILPLLEAAKGKSLILCSLRDILVGGRRDQHKHDERAIETASRFFDGILVHSDAKFARLEESLVSTTILRTPVFYTGFAAKNEELKRKNSNGRRVIVSAGGGIVGEEILQTAIDAKEFLPSEIQMHVVAGAFLPEESWKKLNRCSEGKQNLFLSRFIPNLAQKMANADVSVSQCGYNTVLDILRSNVSALVVPFAEGGEDEQTHRAERLEKLGALRVMKSDNLTAEKLAAEIRRTFAFRPPKNSLDLNGAENTVQIVEELLAKKVRSSRTQDSWLTPVRRTLEAQQKPVRLFFRDDDAGWENTRLFRLMDLFRFHDMPLDVAVIPNEITLDVAKKLNSRIERNPQGFSVHQHGFAHVNHEKIERKCEFGPSRNRSEQYADITAGREILKNFFGSSAETIFTPPWNRCTRETGEVLREIGFEILSRDSTAPALEIEGLAEAPISLDWFAKHKGLRLTKIEIGEKLASDIAAKDTVGVMLHHALIDADERKFLGEMLELLAKYSIVEPRLMRSLSNAKQMQAAQF